VGKAHHASTGQSRGYTKGLTNPATEALIVQCCCAAHRRRAEV